MRFKTLALLALALAACDRKAEVPPAAAEASAPPVKEVAAADAYGTPGDEVTDVAFWSHPTVTFEGLLIAGTASAARAFRIETGEPAFEIPAAGGDLEVLYAGERVLAQGYLISKSNGAYRVFRINQDGKAFDPIALENAVAPAGPFCARSGPAPAIYELASGRLSVRSVTIIANGVELGRAQAVAESENAIACHVDPLTDEIITISADGAIRRIDQRTGAVFGIALPQGLAPAASAFAAGRNEAGEPVTMIALLDGAAGAVSFFDAKDGHANGSVRVKATFDLDAVATASRIAIGSANYGGVYRDGALAVVARGEGAPIRLVPLNGVMGALSLPAPVAIDPRSPRAEPADEGVISIEVIEP